MYFLSIIRKAIESFKEESSAPKREIKLNLTWDKIISAPGGGRRYWEYAQGELITRKKRIKTLELTLQRMKQKLLNVQATICELKDNPYVAVYVQGDK